MVDGELTEPDPGIIGAEFLGWLKRNRAAKLLVTCEKKLRHLGRDLDSTIGSWGQDRIRVVAGRGGKAMVSGTRIYMSHVAAKKLGEVLQGVLKRVVQENGIEEMR